jgi:hypothetical protein
VAIAYVLRHIDKATILVLYVVGLNKLNLVHALILLWLVVMMILPKFASRHFSLVIILALIRDVGRYTVMMTYFSGVKASDILKNIVKLFGFDNASTTNGPFYKASLDWEIPAMLYTCYIQLNVYHYLRQYETEKQNEDELGWASSCLGKCLGICYEWVKKLMFWAIYLTIIILFSIARVSVVNAIYFILIVIIASVHALQDYRGGTCRGYLKTIWLWRVTIGYAAVMLLASYLFSFTMDTMKMDRAITPELQRGFQLIGFQFVFPTGSGFAVQRSFLPQFVVFCLGLFACARIREIASEPSHPSEIRYSSNIAYFVHNSHV